MQAEWYWLNRCGAWRVSIAIAQVFRFRFGERQFQLPFESEPGWWSSRKMWVLISSQAVFRTKAGLGIYFGVLRRMKG
jgi:hypothetical protein